MTPSADSNRPPRRFFGFRGVVRRLRRGDYGPDHGRSGRSPREPSIEADRARQSERARFASRLDVELRLACRDEAATRRELGCAARELMRRRSYRRLGFVRLSDYARERLGVSARSLQSAAWLATRLEALPAVSRAYDRSELSWAQARAICKVAVAADEARWLALARRSTVEAFERLVMLARRPDGVPEDPEGDANEIDGEPAVRWRFACPARVRALWRRALELASRAAGAPLTEWQAAEVVAAEASSGRPIGTSLGDRTLLAALRLAASLRRRKRGGVEEADPPPPEDGSAFEPLPAASDPERGGGEPLTLSSPAPSDPFALDARLVEAMRNLRTAEPRIGRLLRMVVDQRFYKSLGFGACEDYVRERLGISPRKAWALLKLEKATLRSDDFARVYREGSLSWVRALTLLPVLDRQNASAWLARADLVTVRRLGDEVDWVLASRDALGPSVSLAPPPIDSRLPAPGLGASPSECRVLSPDARLQIGAPPTERSTTAGEWRESSPRAAAAFTDGRASFEVCDAEVRFTAPASVIALLRDVLDAFAEPGKPRWMALERVLRHVIHHWESTPRHHDPVFARDRWRCTVPACSSRRNLHDHHIRFRSRGGDNRRDNRTTVCAAHHLHGIHDGTISATGTAPHGIEWQLGVRPGAAPFLAYVGDRYVAPAAPDAEVVHGLG